MKMFHRVMAIVLASAMLVSSASVANAAGSPTSAPKNSGYDTATRTDTNVKDHHDNYVKSLISKDYKKITVLLAAPEAKKYKTSAAKTLTLAYARSKNNKKVNITHIGDGKKGVFNTKYGGKIKTVKVTSEANRVSINAYAFKKSSVKQVRITSQKVTIKKNAFKDTKVKAVKFVLQGEKMKAANFKFYTGAFNGLSAKASFVVKKSAMTNAEFKLLKQKLKRAGFKGEIVRL